MQHSNLPEEFLKRAEALEAQVKEEKKLREQETVRAEEERSRAEQATACAEKEKRLREQARKPFRL